MTTSERRRPRVRKERSEDGDTLIELLIAVAILGVVAVATLFAFSTAISSSATYRGLATLDTVLRSAAAEATTQVQQSDIGGGDPCLVPSTLQLSGYTATFTDGGSCSPTQPQLLTASITPPNGPTQWLAFVVDDPLAPAPVIGTTASKLVFVNQPGDATAGSNLPDPQIEVEDANNHPVTTDLSPVVLSDDASGTPLCTGVPSYGVDTFSDCSIAAAGTYRLTASEVINNSVTSVNSQYFTIFPGSPLHLAFTSEPDNNGTVGVPLASQPVVTVEDENNHPIASSATVTLAVASGNGTINCDINPVTTVSGVADFTGCQVKSRTPGPFTLKAIAGGLGSATSSDIAVAGPAAQLVFTTSPSDSDFGSDFATQPVVTVEDASGNLVTTSTASVTLAVDLGTGVGGCTPLPVTAVAGVATFAGCQITTGTAGTFTLVATSAGLTSATSNSFAVAAGAAEKLEFTTQPSNSASGTAFAVQPVITVEDVSGNPVTTSTAAVALAVIPGIGTTSCTPNTVTAVDGVATFTGCELTTGTAGTFTLVATSANLTSATSQSIKVALDRLVFTTQPGDGMRGAALSLQPVVTVKDASGNTVTADTSSITLAIGAGSENGMITCTASTVAAVEGVASFSGCQISGAVGNYTLRATDSLGPSVVASARAAEFRIS